MSENPGEISSARLPARQAISAGGWRMLIGGAIAVGGVLITLFSLGASDPWAVAGGAGLAALASLAVGAVVGFLFGLPRSPRSEAAAVASGTSDTSKTSADLRYRPNSNLDDISDWLTKILVGIGLTQLGSIPEHMARLGTFMEGIFLGLPGAAVVGVAITIGYAGAGFFFAYLWARMRLGAALAMADAEQLRTAVENVEGTASRAGQRAVRMESLIEQVQRDIEKLPITKVRSFTADAVLRQPTRQELERQLLDAWDRLNRNVDFASLSPGALPDHPEFAARELSDLPGAKRWLERNQAEINGLRPIVFQIEAGPDAMPLSDLEVRYAVDQARKLEDAYAAEVGGRTA